MGYGVCGLFFLRFWRTTRDRLFAIFSAAFWVLGVQRLTLGLIEPVERVAYGAVRAPTARVPADSRRYHREEPHYD